MNEAWFRTADFNSTPLEKANTSIFKAESSGDQLMNESNFVDVGEVSTAYF